MCSVCLKNPCEPRCPNARDPAAVYDCQKCNEGIIPGDEYTEIGGMKYHVECLEGMTIRELLQMFGVYTYTAQEG